MNKDDKDRKVKLLLQTMGLVSAIEGSYMSQDPNDFGFFDNQSEPNDCEDNYEGGEQDG